MIGIDTNVLVRYITRDTPDAPAVGARLEAACTAENPGFISHIVLCELCWVLHCGYGYDRAAIAAVLRQLLVTVQFEIEAADLVWRALGRYESGSLGFADCLIGEVCATNEAIPVLTLDRKAAAAPPFELLTGQ